MSGSYCKGICCLYKDKFASFREKAKKPKPLLAIIQLERVKVWHLSFSGIKANLLKTKYFEFLWVDIHMAECVLPGTTKTLQSHLGLQGNCHIVCQ